MAASVNASANPFVGGAQQRNLAPPGVGLLPPGEADVFATRGEAH